MSRFYSDLWRFTTPNRHKARNRNNIRKKGRNLSVFISSEEHLKAEVKVSTEHKASRLKVWIENSNIFNAHGIVK